MIYLIDDKRKRQTEDFGWIEEKFNNYNQVLKPIYTLEELVALSKEIFRVENTVIYHESFLDTTSLADEAVNKRNELFEFSKNNQKFYLAIFSGSKSSRTIENNIAHLPASTVYQNLEVYTKKYVEGKNNLNYLLFGKNPNLEKELAEKLSEAIVGLDSQPAKIENRKNLFLRPVKENIQNPIENVKEKTLFKDVSDEKLSQYITDWLFEVKYDNIFIPICFGEILSDFNGLRLATHIRCTETPNQLSNIFIYSFVGPEYLFYSKYLNILTTKNVRLLDFKKKSFEKAGNDQFEVFNRSELSGEIEKLKLDPPKNYEDNHSIANEWAIYRWANSIGADKNDELEKVFNNIQSKLYFKYLKTINPISKLNVIAKEHLKIKKKGEPKFLLIDDEVNKGWYEIFAYLLGYLNGIYTDYIGDDFKNLRRDEIVQQSIQKIDDDDIDIVILDYRLHPDDFYTESFHEITGLRILKAIKEYNPGIQVIVFSATTKVWNLQAIQEAGADGFVLKESPENSRDKNFTKEVINSFISNIKNSQARVFLKEFFNLCKVINEQLINTSTVDDTVFDDFIKDLRYHLKMIESSGKKIDIYEPMTLDVVFLNCYNFLEKFRNHYLKEINYKIVLGEEEEEMNRYSYSYKRNQINNEGKFIRINKNDNPSWFNVLTSLFIDYFHIANIEDDDILKLYRIKDKRNYYIHGNKKNFDQNEVLMILNICKKITSNLKE